jgi:hypothetical protein
MRPRRPLFRTLAPLAVVAVASLGGCESGGSAARNIEVLYRFEGLRQGPGMDEWGAIRPVLEKNAVGGVKETRLDRRTLGGVQVATYEARVVLPSVRELERVQVDLERLGQGGRRGERTEVYLTQLGAVYRTNFVAATASVTVSGVGVRGHTVRLFSAPGQPAVETTINGSGVWVATLPAVPEGQWVYGVSMDGAGRVPPRYFRINVATRQQERVEEPEFLKLYPGALGPPGATAAPGSPLPPRPAAAESPEDRALRAKREAEDERLRKQREKEERDRQRRLRQR